MPHLEVLYDPAGEMNFSEIQHHTGFLPLDQVEVPDGVVNSAWVKIAFVVDSLKKPVNQDWFLVFHPYNTQIEAYLKHPLSTHSYLVGAHVPIGDRTYVAPSNMSPCVQKITFPDTGRSTLYAKITDIHESRSPFLEIELVRPEVYVSSINHVITFSSFIVGGLVLMIIMVVILNLYLGHASHYYYLLYLITLLFVEALTAGADTLFIPNHVGIFWEWMEPWFFASSPKMRFYFEVRWYILIIVYFLFIRSYLDLKNLMPLWDKIMRGMIGLGVLATLAGLYVLHTTELDILIHDDMLAAYVGLFFLTVIIFLFALWKTKDPRGIFVIVGFTAIILSATPTLLDIIINDGPSGYADSYLIVGLFIEKIIFTAALSFRQRTIEKKLRKRKEEQKKLLAHQNKMLEETVADRTSELVEKTIALEEAILKQKATQSKLVDNEKMASLGQLTAGIAHEINNPINFVSSNIDSLWLDVKDLKILLENIEEVAAKSPDSELKEKILQLQQETDTKFLFKEMIGLVEGIQYGAERTQEIVKGLRNFSRLDEDGFKPCDIHLGIESTLRILKVEIGKKIQIHKDFGNLPKVTCIPGKLNQVFMNLIANAIHAVGEEGDIYLKTSHKEGQVLISISDNGIGIDKEVQKKIFEPFFTTKEIGKGTGLGLFIVHGIVQMHEGSIEVQSEEGLGTEFIISLPISGPGKGPVSQE